MTVQDWVLERGKKQAGRKPINIAFFGDSITAPTFVGSWPTLMATMLDQYYGLRVNFIKNYAVSGANSTAQSALCTASNIAPYDWVLIMIGVNDIQGGATETTYVTNLTNMINTCTSNGKRVVVGMPTMFYGQGQAGTGKGQATTAYETGKGIRSKCARLCADMGVPLVDTLEMLGPMLANWVNSGLDTLATIGRDPTVFDNIHPTAVARLLFARAFAEKIAGLLMPKQVMDKSATLLPASNLANSWTFGSEPGMWRRNASGEVQLLRVAAAGTTTDGTVFYTLPENIRPLYSMRLPVATDNANLAAVYIDASTGQMSIYNFPVGATGIALDSIRFPTR
jgi:lysophospholipase L1-like esterase